MNEADIMRSLTTAKSRRLRMSVMAALLVLAFSGDSPARDSSTDGSDPAFVALLTDGRNVTGRIVSFEDSSLTIVSKDGKKEALSFDRLVKLTREPLDVMAAGETTQAVLLGDGDRLMRATIGSATDASVEIRSELLGKIEVPLDSVLGLVLAVPGQPAGMEALFGRLRTESRSSEVVWLTNGDRLDGDFVGMDERNIKLEVDHKPLEIDRSGAVALGFDLKLLKYPRPKPAFLEAAFSDGTRLGITSIKLHEGTIEAKARFGTTIRFSVTELARLHARSPSVVYLSEREHAGANYESYVGPTPHFRVDQAVDGLPIRLGGQRYDRGIGTQSRTLLAYRIQPGDRRFQSLIGVDDRAGPLGSVVFRVFVDRQERFKSPPMTDRDPPKALDIDVAEGKILILVTEFGERGNVRDLADWAEARVIR
jgi:NPCBM/NEW2 domain